MMGLIFLIFRRNPTSYISQKCPFMGQNVKNYFFQIHTTKINDHCGPKLFEILKTTLIMKMKTKTNA